jgi:hypothetical protein
VDIGKFKGEVAVHNLGASGRQKKHLVKMAHDPIKFEIGVGMGKNIYEWIQSSFDNKHITKSGAVMICDQNYQVQRRIDFTMAHITEITLPKCDAKGKDALYFSVTIQPETVRHTAGSGSMTGVIGSNQKLHAGTNFQLNSPMGTTKDLISIDSLKWTQKVHAHEVGEFLEAIYVPTAVEVGDLKLTMSSNSYKQWHDAAESWFVRGERTEEKEMTKTLTILGPNAKEPIATIDFENCGLKEFAFAAMEANKDAINTFDCTFYVEHIRLKILKFN